MTLSSEIVSATTKSSFLPDDCAKVPKENNIKTENSVPFFIRIKYIIYILGCKVSPFYKNKQIKDGKSAFSPVRKLFSRPFCPFPRPNGFAIP
jgi:hypothetical protein